MFATCVSEQGLVSTSPSVIAAAAKIHAEVAFSSNFKARAARWVTGREGEGGVPVHNPFKIVTLHLNTNTDIIPNLKSGSGLTCGRKFI